MRPVLALLGSAAYGCALVLVGGVYGERALGAALVASFVAFLLAWAGYEGRAALIRWLTAAAERDRARAARIPLGCDTHPACRTISDRVKAGAR